MKFLVAFTALAAVLATSGCCWPMYEHGHHGRGGWYGQNDGWSEHDSGRPAPPRLSSNDRGRSNGGW